MIYITLDTCVWLKLLGIDLDSESSVFEEICFWIEKRHIIHITPENVIREWERNKVKEIQRIIGDLKSAQTSTLKTIMRSGLADTTVDLVDEIQKILTKRVERIDLILNTYSEHAPENQEVFDESIKRSLNCIAPSHSKDSFRDAVNIFSLITYIKAKGYSDCYFSTLNYKDYSHDGNKKHDLHSHLHNDFNDANLIYAYCDEGKFGEKLFNTILRPKLPNFQDYLKEIEDKKREEILEKEKEIPTNESENLDVDFLDNVKHIDIIFSKNNPTPFETEMLKTLMAKHDSYSSYALKKMRNK